MINFPIATQILLLLAASFMAAECDLLGPDESGRTPAEVIRMRGYRAEEHTITTRDGQKLLLIRATNPLINGGERGKADKDVIVVIHGAFSDSYTYVVNSKGVRPKDYSNYNASNMSRAELIALVGKDPNSQTIVFIGLAFGHEVWLVQRRGTYGSMERNGVKAETGSKPGGEQRTKELMQSNIEEFESTRDLATFNPVTFLTDFFQDIESLATYAAFGSFYNFSMDEQAEYDFPAIIEYVIKESGREKVSLVTHSEGGGITLMALSLHPELQECLNEMVFWSPAMDLGHSAPELPKYQIALLLQGYIGAIPPLFTVPIITSIGAALCANPLNRATICQAINTILFGPAGPNNSLRPSDVYVLKASSGHEIAQLGQSGAKYGLMHKFDYNDPVRNTIAYGQPVPPLYELTDITSNKISFWVGVDDELVSPADVLITRGRIPVPTEFHLLGNGLLRSFNHESYFFNLDANVEVILDTLRKIESNSDADPAFVSNSPNVPLPDVLRSTR